MWPETSFSKNHLYKGFQGGQHADLEKISIALLLHI